jgi:predicted RNA-binding protein (virulence factor B family)
MIYDSFGISKKIFKQAIGGLYKQRKIMIEDNGIRLIS